MRTGPRIAKKLKAAGVELVFEPYWYEVNRDQQGIALGIVHGMDYWTWTLSEYHYGRPHVRFNHDRIHEVNIGSADRATHVARAKRIILRWDGEWTLEVLAGS